MRPSTERIEIRFPSPEVEAACLTVCRLSREAGGPQARLQAPLDHHVERFARLAGLKQAPARRHVEHAGQERHDSRLTGREAPEQLSYRTLRNPKRRTIRAG